MAKGFKQVTFITGASSGIGFALVFELLKRNHFVLASMRRPEQVEKNFQSHPGYPLFKDNLRLIKLDVTKDQAQKTIAKLIKAHGCPDNIINNAGLGVYGPFEEMSDSDFRMQMETNFQGALRVTRAFLPSLRQAKKGKIINVSSILGQLAIPTGSAYSASKWAMEGWSEALRYELEPLGISVSLIEPGLTRTNFKKNMVIAKAPQDTPYRHLHRQIGQEYRRMATSSEFCARRIARIMQKDRPGLRYRIGVDAHLAYILKRIMPQVALDYIVKKTAGKPEK